MAGPWEQYKQAAPAAASGPWAKYQPAAEPVAEPSLLSQVKQQVGNLAAGAVRGAGSIGATIIRPFESASENEARRKAMDEALASMGAQPESFAYGAGKIGAEIAGTAGAGGLAARGLAAVPGVATAAPGLLQAIQTSGMVGPSLTTRIAGGAVAGGLGAGMVNPEDAGTGAAIGGAVPVVGKGLSVVGNAIKRAIGGATGVGEAALSQAYKAGQAGGDSAKAFSEAMRGQSDITDVLTAAKQNLGEMGAQKQAAYRQGMAGIRSDKTVLDLSNVDKAVTDAIDMATYKGQVKNERAAEALAKIKGEIDNWKSLDPADFHTPEGLDALKQKIGGIVEEIPFEQKTARSAASKVYDSIKAEISAQAPEYSKVMKDYSEASDIIKEIERALSLGQKASADTSMRKLQSLMRNNVNTNYGYRNALAQQLETAGGNQLMPALAGQALNEWTPRGIQRALSGTGGAGLALTGNIPAAVGLGLVSSPRLMGEAFYGAGKASNMLSPEMVNALRKGAYRTAPVLGAQ